jgi:hypothetical protein
MKTRMLGLGVAALLAGVFPVLAQPKKAAPPQEKKSEAAEKSAPASGAEAESPDASDNDTVEGRNFYYDPAGRRDPFKSLLIRERVAGERPPGLAGLSVDEIVLEGIWKTHAGYLAQIKGADNRSYLLRHGDLLYDGEVVDVRPNELVLRQNVNDPQSVKPFRDVIKRLNASRPQ